jgi:hypothetical protein
MADEDAFFTAFNRSKEFSALQADFLSVDLFAVPNAEEERVEAQQYKKLCLTVRLSAAMSSEMLSDPCNVARRVPGAIVSSRSLLGSINPTCCRTREILHEDCGRRTWSDGVPFKGPTPDSLDLPLC